MKYLGSKNRIAKHILPIMLKMAEEKNVKKWCEPFVGGANLIDKVPSNFERYGFDSNKFIIALLNKMKEGFNCEYITSEDYNRIKKNKEDYPEWLVGFAGSQLSFGATWFGSYRRDNKGDRDYFKEALNNIKKQEKNIKNITFECKSFEELSFEDSLIYCDPPYNTKATKGKYKDSFNHELFYDWCRAMSKKGNIIFVSEYNMPEDFKCVWVQEKTGAKVNNNVETEYQTEKLFKL